MFNPQVETPSLIYRSFIPAQHLISGNYKENAANQADGNVIKWHQIARSVAENIVSPRILNVLVEFVYPSHFSFQSSYPVWEDFSAKATKLHSQLR